MDPSRRENLSLIEWLGFRRKPAYSNARWFGPILGAFLIGIAFILGMASLVTLVQFFMALFFAGPYSEDVSGESIRNIGLVLGALFGAPFLVWRSIVAAQQAQTAAEALFNDKVNAATQGLSSRRETTRVVQQGEQDVVLREWEDDLVSRVAAIDRLEGLVSEREEAAPRIVKLLATYVRGNFPCEGLELTEDLEVRRVPRMDLQKAIDAIGRILKIASEADPSHWRLDLKGCDLDGVSFASGYYRAVDFTGSRFEASFFNEGVFEGCSFIRCLLNYSSFHRANMRGARLDHIILNRPVPRPGGFARSINLADITGVTFIAADISALNYIGNAGVISKTFATKDTIISHAVRHRMLDPIAHDIAHLHRSLKDEEQLSEDDLNGIDELEKTGFQHWSPYDASDMATGALLDDFFEEMGMNEWPYAK